MSKAQTHRVGNKWVTDYELGVHYWYTRKRLPRWATRNMQQGYVSGAKQSDKCLVASMRHAEREGRFVFLPGWDHLSSDAGTPLSCGNESRRHVRSARRMVHVVKMAQADRVAA